MALSRSILSKNPDPVGNPTSGTYFGGSHELQTVFHHMLDMRRRLNHLLRLSLTYDEC